MIRFFADYLLIIILAISIAVLLWDGIRKGLWRLYPYAVMAGLTSLLVAKLLSLVYQPTFARPFIEKQMTAGAAYIDNPGFPSDHALLGTVAVVGVFMLTKRRKLSVTLGILLVVMAVARVLALVHTPLDIVGGIAAAVFGSLWYLMIPRTKKT